MSTSDWELKEANLIKQLDNGTLVPSGDEGLLQVTLVAKQTGEKMSGMVCDDDLVFNQHATRLFCLNIGYQIKAGVWGRDPIDKYVSE